MSFIRRAFYSNVINGVLRNICYPFKNLITDKFKFPITGNIRVLSENKHLIFSANETSPMLRELFWNHRNCDFEFSNILIDLSKSAKTFFDVGANIGYYTVLVKKANPQIKVFAFEPSNGPYHYLKINIDNNDIKDVIALQKAVGNQDSSIEFYEDINPKFKYLKYHVSGTGNTENTWKSDQINKYHVECITIDDFITGNNINSLDLMKIDTEATEDKVLLGCLDSILKYKPIIICEVLPNMIENKILTIVKDIDYHIYQHIEKNNTLASVSEFNDSTDRNYIFVPKEKIYLLNKYIK